MAFSFGTGAAAGGGGLFRPTAPAQTTGITFGATPAASAPTFGFGAPTSTAPAAAAPTFGFGAPTSSAAAPTFGFGAPASTAAPSFSFGAPTSTAAPSFSFGAPAASAAAPTFGFGAPTSSAPAPTFGFGAPTFGFGAPASTAAPSFSFVAPAASAAAPSAAPAAGLFGAAAAPTGLFGAPQQQLQQQQQQPGLEPVLQSTIYCNVYGDERDAILGRWNVLQAAWGTGKGYYSGSAGPVEYTSSNSLCRFKSLGYSKLPEAKNEDGIVGLLINKGDAEVRRDVQAQVVSCVGAAFGNKPTLSVVVEGVSGLDAAKTELLVSLHERSATGAVHRAPASDLAAFLWQQQPSVRAQLTALGVVSCVPKMRPPADQLREYLATPPQGVDGRLWKQAQAENPDPQRLVPIPLVGFGGLVRHLHQLEKDTRLHQATLDTMAEQLSGLQSRDAETSVALSELRRRHIDLQHRVLRVLVRQECQRKLGFSLQPEEEQLRVQLDSIDAQLAVPTQFRGRLNELLSQIRMRQSTFTPAEKMNERYNIEPAVLDELKQVLKTQQEGIAKLMSVLKEDLADFQVLEGTLKAH